MSDDDPIWVTRLSDDETEWEVHLGPETDRQVLKHWIDSKEQIDLLEVHIEKHAGIEADEVVDLAQRSDITVNIHDTAD
jgi:hypothetical protein